MSQMYTKEQLDIELLKNNVGGISKALDRLDSSINRLEQKVDLHFHWMLGSILGLYGISLTGVIMSFCKAYGLL